jgi:hypothetical protein
MIDKKNSFGKKKMFKKVKNSHINGSIYLHFELDCKKFNLDNVYGFRVLK